MCCPPVVRSVSGSLCSFKVVFYTMTDKKCIIFSSVFWEAKQSLLFSRFYGDGNCFQFKPFQCKWSAICSCFQYRFINAHVPKTGGKYWHWSLRCSCLLGLLAVLSLTFDARRKNETCFAFFFFPLWRSNHYEEDRNGTVVGWLPSCHILLVDVTQPLSWGLWINSATKERSLDPARPEKEDSGDYTWGSQRRENHLLPVSPQWNPEV